MSCQLFLSGTLQLYQHQIDIRLFYQLTKLASQQPASTTGVKPFLESSIVALARLDVFNAPPDSCSQVEHNYRASNSCQKLYHKTFRPYEADTYN